MRRDLRSLLGSPPLLGALGLLGAAALLELLPRIGVVPRSDVPPLSATLSALADAVGGAQLWAALGDTLQAWGLGLGLAVLVGIPLGLAIGSSAHLYRAVRVPLEFLRPVPSVALIPLAVLLYGTRMQGQVLLVGFASLWPILVQTLYGVQAADGVARDTLRVFGVGRLGRIRWLTLPSALSYVVTGVRISAAIALIVAITAELVIGAPGLGREIGLAQNAADVELLYGLVLLTGVLGLLVNGVWGGLERRVTRWHPRQRGAG